jgi:hypothetical protein
MVWAASLWFPDLCGQTLRSHALAGLLTDTSQKLQIVSLHSHLPVSLVEKKRELGRAPAPAGALLSDRRGREKGLLEKDMLALTCVEE